MQPAILCWDIENSSPDSTMDLDFAMAILKNKIASEGMELTMIFAPGCVSQDGMINKFKKIETLEVTCHAITQKVKGKGGDEADYQIIMEIGKFRRHHPYGAVILISKNSGFNPIAKFLLNKGMKFVFVKVGESDVPKWLLDTAPIVWDWKEMYEDAVASMVS